MAPTSREAMSDRTEVEHSATSAARLAAGATVPADGKNATPHRSRPSTCRPRASRVVRRCARSTRTTAAPSAVGATRVATGRTEGSRSPLVGVGRVELEEASRRVARRAIRRRGRPSWPAAHLIRDDPRAESATETAAHECPHRRQEQQEPEQVGDEAGDEEQEPRHQQQPAVDEVRTRDAAGVRARHGSGAACRCPVASRSRPRRSTRTGAGRSSGRCRSTRRP